MRDILPGACPAAAVLHVLPLLPLHLAAAAAACVVVKPQPNMVGALGNMASFWHWSLWPLGGCTPCMLLATAGTGSQPRWRRQQAQQHCLHLSGHRSDCAVILSYVYRCHHAPLPIVHWRRRGPRPGLRDPARRSAQWPARDAALPAGDRARQVSVRWRAAEACVSRPQCPQELQAPALYPKPSRQLRAGSLE